MSLSFILFYLTYFCGLQLQAQNPAAKKNSFFVPQVSVKMSLSGDISDSYQFAGPQGARLLGAAEKPDSVCENESEFQKVIHAKERSLQIWMRLKCTVNGQTLVYQPSRFFVKLSAPEEVISLPVLSEKFRKISIQLTELQLKDNPSQK